MSFLPSFHTFIVTTLLCSVAQSACATSVPEQDVKDSHDHPLISRFAGSVLVGYQTVDYDRMQIPLGKYAQGTISPLETVEGKITRILYAAPKGKSALEVYRNYQRALAQAGFSTRFECHSDDSDDGCGDSYDFAYHIREPLLDSVGRNAMLDVFRAIGGEVYALTLRLERGEGEVDVSLVITSEPGRSYAGVFLQICEHQPMATGQVTVDAKAIGEGLAQTGHIALYGITFATDSATLDPTSQPTLVQMAKVLTEQPALKVYVVGHSDASGNLANNLDLSQRRAEAVVAALVKDYHIAPTRLLAKGMASFAPVASNDDEAGRARNRRVELVKSSPD